MEEVVGPDKKEKSSYYQIALISNWSVETSTDYWTGYSEIDGYIYEGRLEPKEA